MASACIGDDTSTYMATPAELDIPPFFESSILPPVNRKEEDVDLEQRAREAGL